MKQYPVTYNRTATTVLTLIFVPLLSMPIFLYFAFNFRNMPEWGIFTMIFAVMGAALAATVYMVKKISPKGQLTIDDDGFYLAFGDPGLFVPRSFTVKTADIRNFYPGANNGAVYLNFSTTTHGNFSLSAKSRSEEDTALFSELMDELAQKVDNYNEVKPEYEQPITVISIYQRKWMKGLIIISMIMIVAAVGINIVASLADAPAWLWLIVIIVTAVGIRALFKKKKVD